MNKVQNDDISYSRGDTFKLRIYRKRNGIFTENMQCQFIIARNESSEPIINKTYRINDDLTFTLTLSNSDIDKLQIGDYIYKIILNNDSATITKKSGYFIVKWGA